MSSFMPKLATPCIIVVSGFDCQLKWSHQKVTNMYIRLYMEKMSKKLSETNKKCCV